MNYKLISIWQFVVLMFAIILIACQHNRLDKLTNYYEKTEILLDYIYEQDECFMDTTGKTDIYCEYSDAYLQLNY